MQRIQSDIKKLYDCYIKIQSLVRQPQRKEPYEETVSIESAIKIAFEELASVKGGIKRKFEETASVKSGVKYPFFETTMVKSAISVEFEELATLIPDMTIEEFMVWIYRRGKEKDKRIIELENKIKKMKKKRKLKELKEYLESIEDSEN